MKQDADECVVPTDKKRTERSDQHQHRPNAADASMQWVALYATDQIEPTECDSGRRHDGVNDDGQGPVV